MCSVLLVGGAGVLAFIPAPHLLSVLVSFAVALPLGGPTECRDVEGRGATRGVVVCLVLRLALPASARWYISRGLRFRYGNIPHCHTMCVSPIESVHTA